MRVTSRKESGRNTLLGERTTQNDLPICSGMVIGESGDRDDSGRIYSLISTIVRIGPTSVDLLMRGVGTFDLSKALIVFPRGKRVTINWIMPW